MTTETMLRWEDLVIGDTLCYGISSKKNPEDVDQIYEILLKQDDKGIWTTLNTKHTDQNKLNQATFAGLAYGDYKDHGVINFKILRDDVFYTGEVHPDYLAMIEQNKKDSEEKKQKSIAELSSSLEKIKVIQERIINNPQAEISDDDLLKEWSLIVQTLVLAPQLAPVVQQWQKVYIQRIVQICKTPTQTNKPEISNPHDALYWRGR